MNTPLYFTLLAIRNKLQESGLQIVLAESCTSGLVAAELGGIPGISEFFCGSQVVYQTQSKIAWLAVDRHGLEDSSRGPVSQWTSDALASSLLAKTPQATVAAAITGHLGPNSPLGLDGAVFFAIRFRSGEEYAMQIRLTTAPPSDRTDWLGRQARQREAAVRFLQWIEERLTSHIT